METIKSLDYSEVITALLCDVQTLHSNVFTSSALQKTLKKCLERYRCEGVGFLTKTLPRLGKALDKALACVEPLDAAKLGFNPMPNSKLPMFMGELFEQVLTSDGTVRHDADVTCVKDLREILFVFYKLEIPYDPELEQQVIDRFIQTENEVALQSALFNSIVEGIENNGIRFLHGVKPTWVAQTIRRARVFLYKVFASFDCSDIYPRHGPGAVSTKETLWEKYQWTNIPKRIAELYPVDAYFHASLGHVCDIYKSKQFDLTESEDFAKVVLVPKDSRGPRLISCEPLTFQWIQQGLSEAIVDRIEHHSLTAENVRFTDQNPNRIAALYGSAKGRYATLDLNEASDRVSLGLVRLLFPSHVLTYLEGCRSLGTRLPDGRRMTLHKFAPMGSALCFPVLALTVFSVLAAGLAVLCADAGKTPEETQEVIDRVYVYGDDVIVPAEYAEHAMNILTVFGLKINRDKSCTKGLFRESCGMDAYKGVDVTPVRFRTPWSSLRRPEAYTSWIAYANSMFERKYFHCYNLIVERLIAVYNCIPSKDLGLQVPSLYEVPEGSQRPRHRVNLNFQKVQYLVYDVSPMKVKHEMDGWSMLLRWFAEARASRSTSLTFLQTKERLQHNKLSRESAEVQVLAPFSVREYTLRNRSKLRLRWR